MAQPAVDPGSPVPFTEAIINLSLTAAQGTIIAAVANRQIYIFGLFLTNSVPASTFQFQDGNTNLTGLLSLVNGLLVLPYEFKPWFETSVGNAFNVTTTGAATQLSGRIYYAVE